MKIVHLPEKLARRCIVYWGTPILKNMPVNISKQGKAMSSSARWAGDVRNCRGTQVVQQQFYLDTSVPGVRVTGQPRP